MRCIKKSITVLQFLSSHIVSADIHKTPFSAKKYTLVNELLNGW